MIGSGFYDILKNARTAFQYMNPTVRLRMLRKLMKIISLHLYHKLTLFYLEYLRSSWYTRNMVKEKIIEVANSI